MKNAYFTGMKVNKFRLGCFAGVQSSKECNFVYNCMPPLLVCGCIYRICKFHKEIQSLEEVEKRYKNE
ncbi:B-cell receptor-associated-like protein [Gossypium australe]|uniref:B-cell receptor-associated-like protein n=1 Tax=Gossypium australe TaxID=47621 RepID=A0A5B6WS02_9ROSI|nr:B-cell receptor-associated-like protein [Gossypium australe]